jgi:serine protease SohB
MDQLVGLVIFFAKALIVLGFFALLVTLFVGAVLKLRRSQEMEFEDLSQKYVDMTESLIPLTFSKKVAKRKLKELKKELNADEKEKPRLFVLEFKGDVAAKQVEELRDEVTTVLTVAQPGDEILLKVESPGGTVHGYGLAAAQMKRLKSAQLGLTVAVDKVAASGGYLMAATAHKIIAAPFAIVGSIGVVAQVPNIHRLLKDKKVDYEEITSGEYKRTVSLLGEITEKGRKKFTEQIEDTHRLFKEFVIRERPSVDIENAATGEYWYGERALQLRLVDEILTSDDYIFQRRLNHKLIKVKIHGRKTFSEKLSEAARSLFEEFKLRI